MIISLAFTFFRGLSPSTLLLERPHPCRRKHQTPKFSIMTTRFGVGCARIWCLSSPPVTQTPNIWRRLDSNFWCRHLIWRIWCRTQIFDVGTYFWQKRIKHETRGCTCGNHLKCVVPCAKSNDVMRDAACRVSRRQSVHAGTQPCASEKTAPATAATEGQGVCAVHYERADWDGTWRLWRPGAPPRRGVLARERPRYSRG
jgi:hypothetical protein